VRLLPAQCIVVDRSIHTGVERTYTYDDDVSMDELSAGCLKYCCCYQVRLRKGERDPGNLYCNHLVGHVHGPTGRRRRGSAGRAGRGVRAKGSRRRRRCSRSRPWRGVASHQAVTGYRYPLLLQQSEVDRALACGGRERERAGGDLSMSDQISPLGSHRTWSSIADRPTWSLLDSPSSSLSGRVTS